MERWYIWSVNSLLNTIKTAKSTPFPTNAWQWIDNRVVFVTGGAGSICSAQTRAMVYLGANACIIGRDAQKTESVAADIATARKGAKVLAIACDVRDVRQPLVVFSG